MLKVQALRWITSALCAFAGLSGLAVATGDERPAVVAYKSAADIPVADFFRLPRYSQMAMSPDGKRLAALAPVKGRDNLVIVDLVQQTSRALTTLDYVDVSDFLWLDDQRIFFRTRDHQLENGAVQIYSGYFAIDTE